MVHYYRESLEDDKTPLYNQGKNFFVSVVVSNDYAYYKTVELIDSTESLVEISKTEFDSAFHEISNSTKGIVQYQPTNAEVAQMISDLQADLIIAGVI